MANTAQSKIVSETSGLLKLFIHHPNAANLLMVLLLIGGLFSVKTLNTQFFPNFIVDRTQRLHFPQKLFRYCHALGGPRVKITGKPWVNA